MWNIGAVLSNDVVVLSNIDAVLTLGRTLLVFSLYFQTFRIILESFSHGFSLERYVTGVAQELVMGLWGLVEEK